LKEEERARTFQILDVPLLVYNNAACRGRSQAGSKRDRIEEMSEVSLCACERTKEKEKQSP